MAFPQRRRWALGVTAAGLAAETTLLMMSDHDLGLQAALFCAVPVAYVAAWGIARRANPRWWKTGLPLAAITAIIPRQSGRPGLDRQRTPAGRQPVAVLAGRRRPGMPGLLGDRHPRRPVPRRSPPPLSPADTGCTHPRQSKSSPAPRGRLRRPDAVTQDLN